ncbi:MAG TPA: hypothetical protein VF169_23995 [Albitalea sp.]|uniref:hypothetical protein n=1 Tax=Piscinibacter sp. TaxID=1903157 RepID=UPI002ED2B0D5
MGRATNQGDATRPDLGDVSKGRLVTLDNFEVLFREALNPKQLEGLRLLLTPFPQQQFNLTEDRRSLKPHMGVACFDCHANGHGNAATHTVGDIRPNELRHRIDTPSLLDFPPAPKLDVFGKLDPGKASPAELRGEKVFHGKGQCRTARSRPSRCAASRTRRPTCTTTAWSRSCAPCSSAPTIRRSTGGRSPWAANWRRPAP